MPRYIYNNLLLDQMRRLYYMWMQAGQCYLVISHNKRYGKLRKHVAKINEVGFGCVQTKNARLKTSVITYL